MFVSVYTGGIWQQDSHKYTRDVLKPNAKKERVGKIVDERQRAYKEVFNFDSTKSYHDQKPGPLKNFYKAVNDLPLNDAAAWEGIVGNAFAPFEVNGAVALDLERRLKDQGVEGVYTTPVLRDDIQTWQRQTVMPLKEGITPEHAHERYMVIMNNLMGELDRAQAMAAPETYRDFQDVRVRIGLTPDGLRDKGVTELYPILQQILEVVPAVDRGGAIGVAITTAQNLYRAESDRFAKEQTQALQEGANAIFDAHLKAKKEEPIGVAEPFVTENGGAIQKPDDDLRSATFFDKNIEGTTKPERPITPLLGCGVGYLSAISGHAFAGAELYYVVPVMRAQYALKVKDNSFGNVYVTTPLTLRATAIIGKLLNPFVGLYTKAGGEFTHMRFRYEIENEQPPFEKKGGGFTNSSADSQSGSEVLSANIFAAFAGVGAMFINKRVAISLEYSFSKSLKSNIRQYDEGNHPDGGRHRGYVYSSMSHQVMIRVMYLFSR